MKLSTKGQYALEALLDLMTHSAGGQESLGNIARRRGISENYLEQIFNTLRKAGILESIRGAQGGYRLTREPRHISAGEVIRALEGPLSPVKCVCRNEGEGGQCPMAGCCATRWLWVEVAGKIDEVVDGITLADLLRSYRSQQDANPPEYFI